MIDRKGYAPLKSLIGKQVKSIRVYVVDKDFDIVFTDGTVVCFYSKDGIMYGIEKEDYNEETSYEI